MNKQAAHDRMVAVARAKDQIKHEMLQEMDRVRAKLKEVGDFISTKSLWKQNCLFFCLCPAQEFFTHMETSPLMMKLSCTFLTYTPHLRLSCDY